MAVEAVAGPIAQPATLPDDFEDAARFNRRALFVGGCVKSGTTLLLSLLDGHPDLAVFPRETHFAEEARKHEALGADYHAKLERLLTRLDARRPDGLRFAGQGSAEVEFERFARLAENLISRPGTTDSFVLSETVRAYMAATGWDWRNCVRWVEKTPTNAAHADELFRLFPEAKLLQIVRDPRAVFASRRQRLINRFGSYAKAHRLVREWNESARQMKRYCGCRSKYLAVRYEDLVRDSRTVLKKICRFAGIKFQQSLFEPTLAGEPWPGNPTFCEAFDRIDSEPADQWRTELTEDEVWWVEMHCREGMEIAGYEIEADAKCSARRWAKRLPGESWRGYLHARKSSLCQLAGLLKGCRYDLP